MEISTPSLCPLTRASISDANHGSKVIVIPCDGAALDRDMQADLDA